MKLVIAVVHNDDSRNLLDQLSRKGYSATTVRSTGGVMRVANTTVYCGVEDAQVEDALSIIRESCPARVQYVTPLPPVMEPGEVHIPTPVEKQMGGAIIFVVDVEHFEKV